MSALPQDLKHYRASTGAPLAIETLCALIVVLAISIVPADGADDQPRMAPFRAINADPIKPPRCPKWNVDRERLLTEYASKADQQEWRLDCHYTPGLRT